MRAADLAIAAVQADVEENHWVRAAVILAVACGVASVVDQMFRRRGRVLAENLLRGGISREVDTRLRFVRRLVSAGIVFVGVAFALSEFEGINRLANSLLASGAIAAAIIGFAARQTLANVVAGVMLAIAQPLRVGDWVTFEDHYGQVEDVRLNYTVLRTPGDQRVVIPNERLSSGVLRNDTLAADVAGLDVALWLPLETDVARAVEALAEETGREVTVAEVSPDGVRISVSGDPVPPADKAKREAVLRGRCLQRLRVEGLLPGGTGERV